MKVLLSWLQEFAPGIDGDPVELGETLSALGLAVEEMTITGQGLDGIVLAKVLELSPHPDADKIQIVQVDSGDGQPLQVCCGAFNMSVGDLIPFATVGTTMPDGMEIGVRKMRGQESNGMCCSATEIGLGDDADGIMLLTDTADESLVGQPITTALGMESDVLYDLEVNANRPDAMSVAGVARDLAAVMGVPFSYPDFSVERVGESAEAAARVDVLDPDLCGRFSARVLRNVTVGESPQWIQNRLIALGMRPINSVVDISNYVMLELGQPNHVFDLDTLPDGHLQVRRARDGETMITLDEAERTLISRDGVITDTTDAPISLAGVMGGLTTEVTDSTVNVLLEMAWWDPPSISRTVKRLNLPSEASTRFRRGADWGANIDRAMDRFCQLISQTGAAIAPGQIEAAGTTPDVSPKPVRTSRVNSLLGTELTAGEMVSHLTSIGFTAAEVDGDLSVGVPTWRWDVTTDHAAEFEASVAEEVGRLHGYEDIPKTVPKGEQAGHLSQYQQDRRLVREILIGAGCDETQPMPFLAPGDLASAGLSDDGVELSNPLDASESVLRTSLLPGQLKSIAYNQSHRNPAVRFFEIGTVFLPPAAGELLPDEREILAVALADSDAREVVRLLNALATMLALPNVKLFATDDLPGMHPTRSAEVVIAGQKRGMVGEVAPAALRTFGVEGRVAWLQLDLSAILNGPHGKRSYRRVSKYPSSDMDLAFVVDEAIGADKVRNTIGKAGGDLLVDLSLIDVYRGEGVDASTRSLTFHLRFQAADRTLKDVDLTTARDGIIAAVAKHHNGVLRGQ